MEFLGVVAFLGSALLIVVYRRNARRQSIRAWCSVAKEAGVVDVVGGDLLSAATILTGRLGPYRLRLVDLRPKENPLDGHQRVRLVIEGLSGITLREESAHQLEFFTSPRELQIGDTAFDREFYVHGSPEHVRAALGVETRRILRPLLKGRIAAAGAPGSSIWAEVVIRHGDIVAEFGERETAQLLVHLEAVLETLREVADRLAPPESVALRIMENNREEPEWQVRLGNVRLLAQQFPQHPSASEALQHACEDEEQEVRLEAALALGPERAEVALRQVALAESSADPLAARALVALGGRLSQEQLCRVLDHALRTRRPETARTCVVALGTLGGPSVVEPLAKVLAQPTGELAAAAARALGASRAEAAEAPLLAALKGAASDVRVAAAEALGRVGGAGAVLPLREIASENLLDGALRKAARESIAEIQSRLSGASPGQLSLAQGQGGELSLAGDDSQGRVSITEDTQ